MNFKRIIAGLSVIALIAIAASFTDPGDGIIQKAAIQLDKWSLNYPVEKVYLQLDKPYYSAGDDIWFKAYVTLGGKHQLSGLSGILNVELIDEQDSIIRHIKIPVISGLAWGDFSLADTLHEGNYRIRAYTNYMRNAGEDYFFDQHIAVVNPVSSKVFAKTAYTYATQYGRQIINAHINYADANDTPYVAKHIIYSVIFNAKTITKGKGITDSKGNLDISFINTTPSPLISGIIYTKVILSKDEEVNKIIPVRATSANVDVQFMPEGGNLVNNIESKFAFKAVGADGLGTNIKGTIIDDKNNVVTTFSSRHLGMGTFNLLPLPGINYKANVIFADGSSKTIDLPKAANKGYVLSIAMDDINKLTIKIATARQTLIDNPDDTVSLVAVTGCHVIYAAKSIKGVGVFTASVPYSHFPSGIVQFTLFSSTGEPLNERLVFIQNPDQLKLDLGTETQVYAPQQKVNLKLNAQTADGKPDIGSFSVSVTDETKVPLDENKESSIMANLLLTSDLRGYIEQPNYYFNDPNTQTRADLDRLMMTQGYHRFEWKEVLNDKFPPLAYQPEKSLQISGHVTTLEGKPVVKGKVTLLSTKNGFFMADTVTDDHGNFAFRDMVFKDSLSFGIQARTAKGQDGVMIALDNIKRQPVNHNKNAPDQELNIINTTLIYAQSSKKLYKQQVKYGLKGTVMLKEVVIRDTRPPKINSSNLNGPGNADQVLTGDQIPKGFPSLASALAGRLVGVRIINGKFPKTINFIVDGAFVNYDDLQSININDVETVEVLRSIDYLGVYGVKSGGGIIIFTLKTGADMINEIANRPTYGMLNYSPIGYYKARTFYAPQYDDPKTNTALADLRTTIYWNPDIVTDKNGNASFNYFNAGSKGIYRVVVEGMDVDGNIGRKVYRYKVE